MFHLQVHALSLDFCSPVEIWKCWVETSMILTLFWGEKGRAQSDLSWFVVLAGVALYSDNSS